MRLTLSYIESGAEPCEHLAQDPAHHGVRQVATRQPRKHSGIAFPSIALALQLIVGDRGGA